MTERPEEGRARGWKMGSGRPGVAAIKRGAFKDRAWAKRLLRSEAASADWSR